MPICEEGSFIFFFSIDELKHCLPQMSRNLSPNAENVQTIDSRTSQYFNSFLPSAVREWDNLPLETRRSDSVNSFKRSLNRGAPVVPKYYYSGNRKFQILHTMLRTNCSSLYYDLFLKIYQLLLYCCFTSTVKSKVMSGRSVNLTTLPGQA